MPARVELIVLFKGQNAFSPPFMMGPGNQLTTAGSL